MAIKLLVRLVSVCALLLGANLASATTFSLVANLESSQEVPANGSLATGFASMAFDDTSNLLSWDISWSGLSGPATGMHFHGPAAPGVNAGVAVNIGSISGLNSPSIGSANITDAQATDLLAGLWYINIHTVAFPGGEIRGQVGVVPVPAAVWLFGSGLLGLVGFARRKA